MAAVLMGTATINAQTVTPPYLNEFASSIGDMKVINTDADSPSFIFSSYGGNSYGGGVTYTGNSTYKADDYLVSPALEVKEGNIYTISFMYKNGASGNPYKVSIVKGDAEDNLTEVIDSKEIDMAYSFATFSCNYEAKTTGTVYFAIHIEREAGTGTIAFDNFSVSAGVSAKAPAAMTNFTATPKVEANKFVVALDATAPTLTHSGAALDGKVKVTVKRSDDKIVGTKENVNPGDKVSIVDEEPLSTNTTYTICAENDFGTSTTVDAVSNPTFGTPAAVSGLSLTQDNNKIALQWEAVTTSASSATAIFIPSEVTYKVFRVVGTTKTVVAQDLKTTSFNDTYEMPESGQDAVYYTVSAVYGTRTGAEGTSQTVLIGNPYKGEYAESFAQYAYNTKTWTVEGNTANVWMTTSSSYTPSCSPQDEDNGMLKCQNTGAKNVWIASPIINVSEMKNPRLDFYVYQDPSLTYTNAIQTIIRTSKGDTVLGDKIAVNGGTKGWNRFSFYIPEDTKAGDLQIVFNALPGSYAAVCIDNITIKDILDNHLVLEEMDVPESVKLGETFAIKPVLENKGSKVATGYSVKLTLNGEELASVKGDDINSDTSKALEYEFRATPAYAGKTLTFEAQLVYDVNESTEPNKVSKTVTVETNDYPTPTELAAKQEKEAIILNWTKAEVPTEGSQENVSEDFEGWTSYTAEGEKGWTFVNANGTKCTGIDDNHASTTNAVMIADNVKGYAAKSGTKVLAFSKPYSYRDTPDYWAISPEVIGGQTISFSAVSYNKYAYISSADQFVVCYSTGSTDPKDFKPVGEATNIKSLQWLDYTAELPADATRFAIHVTKTNNDGIFFDDLKFVQGTKPVVFKSYNVYRNSELIATTEDCTYTDKDVTVGNDYIYNVSAVYDRGESLWSNEATVQVATGIGNVEGSNAKASVRTVEGGIIVAADNAAVKVVTPSGALVYAGVATGGKLSVALQAGIYLVQVDGATYKVCVK